jgi:hypothetical protein
VKDFDEKHGRVGIVTNQPNGYDPNRNHAATIVCDRPACRRAAMAWVAAKTGETPVYVSDASRKAGAR